LIVSSVFFFSWPVKTEFFDENKNTHPKWVLVATKKISARTNEVSNFARGKTFSHFWAL
jgi:hypothetical protein